MRLLLFCVVAALLGLAGAVDEEYFMPHVADTSVSSDREILSELENDAKTDTTTTTTTTTAAATTTTKAATTAPAFQFSLKTLKLMEEAGLSVRKALMRKWSDKHVRRIARYTIRRRERRDRKRREEQERERKFKEEEEKREQEEKHHEEELEEHHKRELEAARQQGHVEELEELREIEKEKEQEEAERKRKAEEERRRRAADYLPPRVKTLMSRFGLDWRQAERQKKSVSEVEDMIRQRAVAEERKLESSYKNKVSSIKKSLESDFSAKSQEISAESEQLLEQEQNAEKGMNEFRDKARSHIQKVVDRVRRKDTELKKKLVQTEAKIEEDAMMAEKEAEEKTEEEAREISKEAQIDIRRTREAAQGKARETAQFVSKAKHYLEDVEVPKMNQLVEKEQEYLNSKMSEAEVETQYKMLNLRRKLSA